MPITVEGQDYGDCLRQLHAQRKFAYHIVVAFDHLGFAGAPLESCEVLLADGKRKQFDNAKDALYYLQQLFDERVKEAKAAKTATTGY